jgi:transposase-like protein
MARTRRIFSAEFKAKVVLEIISGNKSMAEACREYNLKADLLSHWKAQFLDNAAKVFETTTEADPQQTRIAELERLAGKQSLEMEILKKALTLLPQIRKKSVS